MPDLGGHVAAKAGGSGVIRKAFGHAADPRKGPIGPKDPIGPTRGNREATEATCNFPDLREFA